MFPTRKEPAMPGLERKWWTLIAVCTATFMLLLDITVVNVALPDIQRSLHSSFSDLQWVIDAYSLTLAAFLLTAGVIGDMYGRRVVFAVGLGVFSASSLVCGLSTSSLMLNLSRAAQGVGGAIMFATSLALIAQAFSGRERGTAFGIYGAVIGGAVAVGPLIGGAITSGIGWRWIFFVNVPIGVLAVFITLTRIQESRDASSRSIDWIGFISFSVALFMLIFGLVRGNDDGWDSALILGLLIGAAVLLVVFIVAEWRQDDPMLDLTLFRRPAMVGVSLAAFTVAASIFALFLYLTLYIQDDLGYAPLAAGVRFLPITILAFIVAPFAGKLTVRINARYLLGTGLLLVSAGCLLMATTHPASGWTVLLPGFIVCGIGIGTVNPVLASSAISVVPPQRSGMASGANNTFRQVGIATGIAALGTVFQSQIEHSTLAALHQTAGGDAVAAHGGAALQGALAGGGVRDALPSIPSAAARDALLQAYRVGFSSTLDHLMIIGAVIALIGSIGSFVLVRQRDFVPSYAPSAEPGTAPAPTPSPAPAPATAPVSP
jgi:EmrB/QacA subfamily drug resistance transporter